MFKNLIERASTLVTRLETVKKAYDEDRLKNLPHSQQVAWPDIDGWFDAAADIIIQAFGEQSNQIQKWKNNIEDIAKHDDIEVQANTFHPIGAIMYKINAMRGLLIEFQDVWDAQSKKLEIERRLAMPSTITISGGTFIGNQIGGVANSMHTYVEQLKLDEYSSNQEKELKEALAALRKEIETTKELSAAEKTAAATDLALLTDQLVKPVDKQDENTKKLFWERLKNILSVSAGLGSLASVVAKLAGLG